MENRQGRCKLKDVGQSNLTTDGTRKAESMKHELRQFGIRRANRSLLNAHVRDGCALAACVIATTTVTAQGALVVYHDRAAWESAAGAITSIGVPNVPSGTLLYHYAPLGVTHFSLNGYDIPAPFADVWGVPTGTNVYWGAGTTYPHISFASPTVTAIALDWLSIPQANLGIYMGGIAIDGVSVPPMPTGDYSTRFIGLISTMPFNDFKIYSNSTFWVREVMFSQIPAPSVAALLALAPLASRRRRR